MYKILTDTGFWIGLYDERDDFHKESNSILRNISNHDILLPWPIMYEFISSRFIGHRLWVKKFKENLDNLYITFIDDSSYREKAINESINLSMLGKRRISLVDMVIRFMLMNVNLKVDYLVTYNEKDFVDVCKKRKIGIYYC